MKAIYLTSTIIFLLQLISFSQIQNNNNIVIKPNQTYSIDQIKGIPWDERKVWEKEYKVDNNGSIHLPLGGKLMIAGKTIQEAEKLIEQHLIDKKIFKDPKIRLKKTP